MDNSNNIFLYSVCCITSHLQKNAQQRSAFNNGDLSRHHVSKNPYCKQPTVLQGNAHKHHVAATCHAKLS